MSVHELGGAMSPTTLNPDVMVRQTRKELARWVEDCLRAAGRKVDAGVLARLVIKEGRGNYRLGIAARVIG